MAKFNGRSVDPAIAELAAMKRLLNLGLLGWGATQKQIADAMGVHQSQVRRMFPNGLDLATRGAS